jgi:nitrite reductase (NO-forming)
MVLVLALPVVVGLAGGCGDRGGSASAAVTKPAAAVAAKPAAAGPAEDLEAVLARGKAVYNRTCVACHQPDGKGIAKVFPPLEKSDYLIAHLDDVIHGVIYGQQGPMTVNGVEYNLVMPPQMLNDQDTADAVTYVLNSFGNPGGRIDVERVAKLRAKGS